MGYWAKDGAYVHEDSDYDTINIREEERKEDERKSARRHAELIEKQNEKIKEEQEYRQWFNGLSIEDQQKELRRKEVQEHVNSLSLEEQRKYYENGGYEKDSRYIEFGKKDEFNEKNVNNAKYKNVPEFVVNPQNNGDRRARANYWAGRNTFAVLISIVTGKKSKFDKLWYEYDKADENRKTEIIAEMEKMYPTTAKKLEIANRSEGRGKSRG